MPGSTLVKEYSPTSLVMSGAHGVGVFVDERHFDAGDDALYVLDQTTEAALVGLCVKADGPHECQRDQYWSQTFPAR